LGATLSIQKALELKFKPIPVFEPWMRQLGITTILYCLFW